MERLGPKINAFDVDAVAGRLKELVSLEKEALLEDIEALRRCLKTGRVRAGAVEAVDDADHSAEPQTSPSSGGTARGSGRVRGGEGTRRARARGGRLISGACGKKIAPALLQTAGRPSRLRAGGADRG